MKRSILFLMSCALAFASACMVTPRNGDQIPSKTATVEIGGFHVSTSPVEIMAYNRQTSQWDTFTTVTPDANQYTADNDGITWFVWDTHVVLPQASQYWFFNKKGIPSIQIKAGGPHNTVGNPPTEVMASFDTSADQCILSTLNNTGSGLQIISTCQSGMSPVATMHVPCGAGGQACCGGTAAKCGPGYYCTSKSVCAVSPSSVTVPVGGGGGSSSCTGAGGTCTVHPSECSATPGFTASGTWQCKSGKLVCVPKQGVDYCSQCGGSCGGCAGNSCADLSLCAPGSACIYDFPTDRMMCKQACTTPPAGSCWALSDVGNCTASAAEMPDD